jgi:SagB-type dehydrogenase family enzyme
VLSYLVGVGLAEVLVDGKFPDNGAVLRQWEFHDLLFHARSRLGRHDYPFGGIFPFKGEIEPRPAVRPAHDGPVVELPRPDLDRILLDDPHFTTVLEGRKSTRVHGERPISLEQLGEFLYRTARVRAITEPLPEQDMPYAATSRPYPTGGASYDLELYLSVHRCDGIKSGIYHYDPLRHSLTLVNSDDADRNSMVAVARVAAGHISAPDVLITLTSRFQRLGWKYRSLPYSATLKNVGVLYQTMYLVATAMGLAGCGLGGGDADLTARVFHLDYLQESSVGEFILGSMPSGPVQPAHHSTWTPALDHGWHSAAVEKLSRRSTD